MHLRTFRVVATLLKRMRLAILFHAWALPLRGIWRCHRLSCTRIAERRMRRPDQGWLRHLRSIHTAMHSIARSLGDAMHKARLLRLRRTMGKSWPPLGTPQERL
eukprot:3321371-Pyramimonas_sp.AAC.1